MNRRTYLELAHALTMGAEWEEALAATHAYTEAGYQRIGPKKLLQWGFVDGDGCITFPVAFYHVDHLVIEMDGDFVFESGVLSSIGAHSIPERARGKAYMAFGRYC